MNLCGNRKCADTAPIGEPETYICVKDICRKFRKGEVRKMDTVQNKHGRGGATGQCSVMVRTHFLCSVWGSVPLTQRGGTSTITSSCSLASKWKDVIMKP